MPSNPYKLGKKLAKGMESLAQLRLVSPSFFQPLDIGDVIGQMCNRIELQSIRMQCNHSDAGVYDAHL